MDIKSGRKIIDGIDKEIVKLLKKRIQTAKKIAPLKERITDRLREKAVLTRAGKFKGIFVRIIDHTKKEMRKII